MNLDSKKWNIGVIVVMALISLCTLILDDSVLIADLGLGVKGTAYLKLFAYIASPILILYNGRQASKKIA